MQLTNPRRYVPFLLGIAAFLAVVLMPALPDTVDPAGRAVSLSHEGKAALGLFLLAGIWWVFEVIPVGVTAIAIGVVQALWLIREPRQAFTDFMDPSVWFIFGSLLIGAAFAKTGLTRVLEAADRYFEASGRRLTFEYVLLADVNDRPSDAQQLAALLRGRPALLNVIPYNAVSGLPYRTPSTARQHRFREILEQAGLTVKFRQRKGDKISAACGQLRRSSIVPKPKRS